MYIDITILTLPNCMNKFPSKYCSNSVSVLNVYLCVYINIKFLTISTNMNKFPNKYCNKSTTIMNMYLFILIFYMLSYVWWSCFFVAFIVWVIITTIWLLYRTCVCIWKQIYRFYHDYYTDYVSVYVSNYICNVKHKSCVCICVWICINCNWIDYII